MTGSSSGSRSKKLKFFRGWVSTPPKKTKVTESEKYDRRVMLNEMSDFKTPKIPIKIDPGLTLVETRKVGLHLRERSQKNLRKRD